MVFEPDPGLGPDPLDLTAQEPRSLGWFIPPGDDCIVIHRQWGEQFEGGSRTHFWGMGSWENLTDEQTDAILNVASGDAEIVTVEEDEDR